MHKDGNADENNKNIPIGDQFKVDDFALRALVHPINKAAKEEEEVEDNENDDYVGYDNFDELQQESIKLSERLQKQIIDDSEVRYPYLLPSATYNQQLDNTSSLSSSTAMDYDFREEKSYLRRATAEAVLKALLEPISDYSTSQSLTGVIPENSIRNSIDMNSKVVKSYVSKMNQQQQQQQDNDVLKNMNIVTSTDTDHRNINGKQSGNDSNEYDNEVVDGLANIDDISRSTVDGSSIDMDVNAYIDDSHVRDDQIDDMIVSSQFNDRIVDDKSPLGNSDHSYDHHHHHYSLPSPELLMHSGYEDHVYDDEVEPSSQYSKRRIARHVSNTTGGEEEDEDEEGYDIPTITYDGENFHIQDNIFNRQKQYISVNDEYNNTATTTTSTATIGGCDDYNHDNINVDSSSSLLENEMKYLSPSNNQYYEDDYLLSIDSNNLEHHHYHNPQHPLPYHGNNNDLYNNEQQQFDYEEDL